MMLLMLSEPCTVTIAVKLPAVTYLCVPAMSKLPLPLAVIVPALCLDRQPASFY